MGGVLLETHNTIEYPFTQKICLSTMCNTLDQQDGFCHFAAHGEGEGRQEGMLRKMDTLLATPVDTLLQKSKELLWEHMVFE